MIHDRFSRAAQMLVAEVRNERGLDDGELVPGKMKNAKKCVLTNSVQFEAPHLEVATGPWDLQVYDIINDTEVGKNYYFNTDLAHFIRRYDNGFYPELVL